MQRSGTPTQAGLKFVCNEKKNFLASQVNSKVESALKAQITETITDNYVTASFDNLYDVKDGMSAAADGSGKINDGLKEVNDKTPLLEDGVNKLNNGSNQLYNGQVSLNSGISQINGGLGSLKNGQSSINDGLGKLNDKIPLLSSGVDSLYKGTGELATGTNALYEGYTKKIYPGVSQLNAGTSQLKQKLDNGKESINTLKASVAPLNKGSIDLSNTSDNVNTGYASLTTGINGVLSNKTLNDEQKAQAIKGALSNFETKALTPYTSGVKGFSSSASKFATGSGALVDNVNTVSGAIDSISSNLNVLQTGLDSEFGPGLTKVNDGTKALNVGVKGLNSNIPELSSGIKQLYDGSSQALAGTNILYDGSTKALIGSNKLVAGQTQLKTGLGDLSAKVPELKSGVTQLYDGSKELSTKLNEGSSKLSSGLVNTPEAMGSFVSSPVELKIEPINAVPNYGTGFAPYFINLSLWIGAIMMFFVITTKTEEHKEASRFAKAFGKYLSFGFVGVLQAVLVGIAVLLLGLSPNNIPLYFASLIFFSLVYIAIVQCLISLFGDAGRLLSIVLLILQLTACAGTFPLELVPHYVCSIKSIYAIYLFC